MKNRIIVIAAVLILTTFTSVFGQQHTENGADQTLHGSGRVNASTLGLEIDIPLGNYPGRGINVPVSLSYSSKLWRMEYVGSQPAVNNPDNCIAVNVPKFAENTASGWTSSLAVPYIEYTGFDNRYQDDGSPLGTDSALCSPNSPPNYTNNAYIRRITVHLPSGETHELRMDDAVKTYAPSSACPGTSCDGNDPSLPANWNGWYYAVDGSNIRYFEDRTNYVYYLQMPDGSKYEFVNAITTLNLASIRKANKFTDRNGNYTTYNDSNITWTDTLGKTITAPLGLSAPTSPTTAQNPQVYSMPGMTGTYKFHWKKLKDSTEAESALTDFNQSLKYMADRNSPNPSGTPRSAGTYLFASSDAWVHDANAPLFNPVVLAEIELPTGQKYKFTYDIFGRIERIYYPTGGEERFEYDVVDQVAQVEAGSINAQTNFGVVNRKVYTAAGQGTPLEWIYDTQAISTSILKVTIDSPDDTKTERYLYRSDAGMFGYDSVLAGMPYDERGYNSASQLVSKKLTTWTKNTIGIGEWHPRVSQDESIIYEGGSGISTTAKYYYDGDLSYRDTPLLQNKVEQYAFVTAGGSLPSNPVRTMETTFLISDPNYSSVKSYYTNQNMIGLATASLVRDSAGTIVSRSEMAYDDSGYSPNVGRGNPTTAKVWDSTKGAWNNSSAYISTRARFDTYGNQYESIDAKGNVTQTEYSATYNYAFPTKVTTAVPSDGTHGSNAAFETTMTYNATTGLPLTTTDINGQTTTMEYDAATLRPIRVTPPTGAGISETVYHDETNNYWTKSRTQIDANNWAESITYFDGLGRAYKSEQVDSQDNIFVEKEFDAQGRVSRVTNPFRSGETRAWTTNTYDEASRIKQVTLPDTSTVTTDYGVSTSGIIGVTKQITDQAGKKRKGISDALGRMVRVIEDPTGQNLSTDYVFDTLGNLRKTTQGEQNRYFSYDSLGRLLYAKQPEQDTNSSFSYTDSITGNTGWSAKYEYDDSGNITKTTDAKNVYVEGTYDNFNRLKTRNYSDSTPDVDFYYDGTGLGSVPNFSKGKTTKITSSVSETRYTSFDNLGRLLTHQQITDGQTYSTGYTYNLSGALIEETYPSGRVVRNILNNDGELAAVQSKKNSNYGYFNYADSFSYNSAGAVTKMQLGNGKWETASYNNRLQVTQIGLGTTDAQQNLLKLEYTYNTTGNTDNNGNLRSQKISFDGLSQPFEQTYTYDSLNRLQSAEEKVSGTTTWKQTFSIDRYGNRRFDAANTTTLGSCSQAVCNPLINTSNNRFSSGQGYSYDANGSVTQDAEGKRFGYDAENHQKEFFATGNNGSTPDATYYYDGEEKRVKKISPTETTVFVYDGSGQLVAEYSTQIAQTPQVSYLTADHLGSPRIITDQNGAVTTRKDYEAFGEETFTAQRTSGLKYDSSETRKGYTGYEKDGESGLDFAEARYYNSIHGRFTSVDPLTASADTKNPQTFNRYSYVLNSPYKFVDPLGLISSSTDACGGFCRNSDGGSGGFSSGYTGDSDFAPEKDSLPNPSSSSLIMDEIGARFSQFTSRVRPKYRISGEFRDREGKYLATDGKNDNKVYLLNEGQNAADFFRPVILGALTGTELQRYMNASTEVGGLIIMTRTEEGADYTISEFTTVGNVNNVSGFVLEPGGPDTTASNQDRRVPAGVYNLHPHNGKKHKDTFGISNASVSKDRAIVFHAGNSGADTEGCILPGGQVSNGKIVAGTSAPKLNELKTFVKSEGANNVKLIIRNK